jgi:NTE family protein
VGKKVVRSICCCAVAAFLLSCPFLVQADEPDPPQRPKIGLVLAGGGAKGIAHIGVIKVLEEMRIPIDYIAGTSMGSLVGGYYASGMSSDRLEELILDLDWNDLFHDNPARRDRSFRRKKDDSEFLINLPVGFRDGKFTRPRGIIEGQKVDLVIKSMVLPARDVADFDDLPIPFRAVAANIENGEAVILASGKLDRALRASMSIPGAFLPVEIDGRLLVDGGMALNLPMRVAREMGADVLIVVDLTVPLKKAEDLNTGFAIIGQSTAFLTRHNVKQQLATMSESDVLIHPIMGDITTADFKRGGEGIPIGEKATREAADELKKYSLSEREYNEHLSARRVLSSEMPVIDFIRVSTDSRVSSEVIESKLRVPVGEPLDIRGLYHNLNIIFGSGYFETVTYDLVTESGQTGLAISAKSRSWGPGYFSAGLSLESNLEGQTRYNVGFRYTRTEINSLAAEWQTDLEIGERLRFSTEFHQPLERSLKLFIAPSLQVEKDNVDLFDIDGDRIAEYRSRESSIALEAGTEIGNWGELRFGLRRGGGDLDLNVGTVPPPVNKFDRGDALFKFSIDTLDNINFPHHGLRGATKAVFSREDLGADDSYERFQTDWDGALTWGKNTILQSLEFGITKDEDAPIYDQFSLGGFLNMSGYGEEELRGQNYGLVRLVYYNRIFGSLTSLLEGVPVYAGASLEAGNVWDDLDNADVEDLLIAGSVFLGADTPLGPLYLAVGRGEGGRDSLYFFLGRTFSGRVKGG